MPKCLIDNTDHVGVEDLHKHLRKLKIRQADYYVKYCPRKDHFTDEPIPFKNIEQYFSTEFLSKENLRGWITKNPIKGREWSVRWLDARRKEKSLIHPPTQVELKSLLCPSRHYYERAGGYNKICESLGYKIKFNGKLEYRKIPVESIIIDTREQLPLELGVKVIRDKLNCGDYGLKENDQNIYIERKSLNDFIGTLSDREIRAGDSNFLRFSRELERANECGAYLIVLVEATIERALEFNELAAFKHVKVQPAHIFRNVRELLHRFENFQVLFVNGREEAARQVINLLGAGDSVKNIDLQFAYETGEINHVV